MAGGAPCTQHRETLGGTTTGGSQTQSPGGAAPEARPSPGDGKGRAGPAHIRPPPTFPFPSLSLTGSGQPARGRASEADSCLIG